MKNAKRLTMLATVPMLMLGLAALHGFSGRAWASSDGGCTDVTWGLAAPDYACSGRAALTPGNDTRTNMVLLMRSLRAVNETKLAYPAPDYDNEMSLLGHSFFTWAGLRQTLWPHPQAPEPAPSSGSAPADRVPDCVQAPDDARSAFATALKNDPALPAADRTRLAGLHLRLGCGAIDWAAERAVSANPAAGDYLTYLAAADAFYTGHWDEARAGFAALTHARSAWLGETAAYMPIRVALRQAVANSSDEYGTMDRNKVDAAAAATAGEAIEAYLKAWPKGRYADSARGLVRRVAWLQRRDADLARIYEQALRTTPGDDEAAANLAEEIDLKLFTGTNTDDAIAHAGPAPLLRAVFDLQAMRIAADDQNKPKPMALSDTDLAAQQGDFTTMPELYAFLKATRSWYAGGGAQDVLKQLPAAPPAGTLSPLAFSSALLRGMALHRQADPGEADYWRNLIARAGRIYQRPLAELGLALHWQRDGQIAAIFAPDSPVQDMLTREILIQTRAGPAILRANANNASRPEEERKMARFTLLYKELSRGHYRDFTDDLRLVPANAAAPVSTITADGIFIHGTWSDGFACLPLAQTAAALTRNSHDNNALLCLGDFWRLNDFDNFTLFTPAGPDTLGYGPDGVPGQTLQRGRFYDAIIADSRAGADQRAYALYRAVMCYAPSGYDSCSGTSTEKDVTRQQRRAWYLELKRAYPDSRWAKNLRYYW